VHHQWEEEDEEGEKQYFHFTPKGHLAILLSQLFFEAKHIKYDSIQHSHHTTYQHNIKIMGFVFCLKSLLVIFGFLVGKRLHIQCRRWALGM